MKKFLKAILIVFVCLALVASCAMSALTLSKQLRMSKLIEQNYGETVDVNQEDDVTIANEYTIKATLAISDAYISGDVSKLGDSDKETLDMASEIIKAIIKKDMSDYEKEKAVYEYLINDLESTNGILTVIPAVEQENDNPHDVLKYHSAVCVGYATTFRMFMQMLGIECKVIHNNSLYHSWNMVKLDEDWYHVDCYSDSGGTKYSNFNMNDTQCLQNHEWTKEYFPAANGVKFNYILSVCEQLGDIYQVPEWLVGAIKSGESVISCTFGEPITDENQFAAKLMSERLVESLESDEYYVEHQWSQNEKNEYVLSFFITYYKDEEGKVDEETSQKINDTIEEALEKLLEGEAMG